MLRKEIFKLILDIAHIATQSIASLHAFRFLK